MAEDQHDSFLTRPPKIAPMFALGLGLIFIPLGLFIQDSVGGALLGGGIGCIIMAAWDTFRLRFFAKRAPGECGSPSS